MTKKDLYFAVDMEANGPIPIRFSMISLGAVALRADGTEVSSFTVNLQPMEGAGEHAPTMAWWAQSRNKAAWEATQVNPRPPQEAMHSFVRWVEETAAKEDANPVFVAYPSGFDFTFVYVYMMDFVGRSPFSFSALDMKSYAMRVLETEFRETTKKRFPKSWSPPEGKHNHIALDDAREQGHMFIQMRKHPNNT